MNVSLNTFLRTGNLGDLRSGMFKEEVKVLLGPPDGMGTGSRRYPQPSLWLYGTVELNFRQEKPRDLTSLWWEAGNKGAFVLTSTTVIQDWAFTPDWSFAQVEDYLRELDITFDYRDSYDPDGAIPDIVISNGISISFSQGRLYGIGCSLS
jgi:hypothetical protein